MKGTCTFRFTSELAGTRVDLDAVVTGNLLRKLFQGTIGRVMEKEDGDYLNRLKDAIENPSPP